MAHWLTGSVFRWFLLWILLEITFLFFKQLILWFIKQFFPFIFSRFIASVIASLAHWFTGSVLEWIHWFIWLAGSQTHWFVVWMIHDFRDSLIHWCIGPLFIDSWVLWFIVSFSQLPMEFSMPSHWHLCHHSLMCWCASKFQFFFCAHASASRKQSYGFWFLIAAFCLKTSAPERAGQHMVRKQTVFGTTVFFLSGGGGRELLGLGLLVRRPPRLCRTMEMARSLWLSILSLISRFVLLSFSFLLCISCRTAVTLADTLWILSRHVWIMHLPVYVMYVGFDNFWCNDESSCALV